jgi:hypothetical protein
LLAATDRARELIDRGSQFGEGLIDVRDELRVLVRSVALPRTVSSKTDLYSRRRCGLFRVLFRASDFAGSRFGRI